MTTPTDTVDVLTVPLRDLWTGTGSALDEAIRKAITAAEDESDLYVSAFNSAI